MIFVVEIFQYILDVFIGGDGLQLQSDISIRYVSVILNAEVVDFWLDGQCSVIGIELERDDVILSLCSGSVVVDDRSVDFIPINSRSLFEQVYSEPLDSGGFSGSYDSQPMCVDNDGILDSDVFDDVIYVRW